MSVGQEGVLGALDWHKYVKPFLFPSDLEAIILPVRQSILKRSVKDT